MQEEENITEITMEKNLQIALFPTNFFFWINPPIFTVR